MVTQKTGPFSLLSLLEASQTAVESSDNALRAAVEAVESSDKALRAAEEALNASKIANNQAKNTLKAVTEAFMIENTKTLQEKNKEAELVSTTVKNITNGDDRNTVMKCESDVESDEAEDFVMLSTNKNPVYDIEDEDEAKFILISSSGPAADNWSHMFGVYRLSEEMREGQSVYVQEHDTRYGHRPCKLYCDQGVWVVKGVWVDEVGLRASVTSSLTSAKWEYHDWDDVPSSWCEDPDLTVSLLRERPSVCDVVIKLGEDAARNMEEPGVAGVYWADGTYCEGRPVLSHTGGEFSLHVRGNYWVVTSCSSRVGADCHLWSGLAPSLCPAAPRAARHQTLRDLIEHLSGSVSTKQTNWGYNKRGFITWSNDISATCQSCS